MSPGKARPPSPAILLQPILNLLRDRAAPRGLGRIADPQKHALPFHRPLPRQADLALALVVGLDVAPFVLKDQQTSIVQTSQVVRIEPVARLGRIGQAEAPAVPLDVPEPHIHLWERIEHGRHLGLRAVHLADSRVKVLLEHPSAE